MYKHTILKVRNKLCSHNVQHSINFIVYMSVRNSIRFTVLLYNVQIVTETETQYASHKYQSSFKMPCENNGIANFTKILEHFRLKI